MTEVLNKNFVTLGNAKPGDYQEEFAFYAKKYLPDLKHFSNDELNQFYQDKKQNIQYIKNLGIVRSLTARLVELYLILDRALFLKENQQDVTVKEVFNSELSPRNIVILAKS